MKSGLYWRSLLRVHAGWIPLDKARCGIVSATMNKLPMCVLALALAGAASVTAQRLQAPFNGPFTAPVVGYEIVRTYPHDTGALTQGLLYQNGFLYESTGERALSSLRKVELVTGKVVQRLNLDPMQQTEGLAELNGRFYALTLRGGFGTIFDKESFIPVGKFTYSAPADGTAPQSQWAIAFDGPQRMIITGPTQYMYIYDPATMKEIERITVKDGPNEIGRLDELEMINGELWINVYQTPRVAVVDPKTGVVKRWVDFSGIVGPEGKALMPVQPEAIADHVLNGIAWDAQGQRLFVTGKNFKQIFEVRVKPRSS